MNTTPVSARVVFCFKLIWYNCYMVDSNEKEKIAIYIDGSNFYGYLKDEEINF